jgi:hypothetical protein
MWAEPHPKPKWDLFISALLAYAIREVQRPEYRRKKRLHQQRLANVLNCVAAGKAS